MTRLDSCWCARLRPGSGLALALALLGCRGATEPPTSAVAGRYALVSVDGHPLPYLSADGPGGPVYLFAQEYLLRPDGTYDAITVSGPPGMPTDTARDTNTWRLVARSGPDSAVLTFGHDIRHRFEFGYAVLPTFGRSRVLRADRTLYGTPLPVRVFQRR